MSAEKPYITLAELMNDPELLKPPKSVVSRLAWSKRVTMLAGREKGGKSTLAGAAAAALSAGRAFLGEDLRAGNVLVVALEEHPQELVQRLVRFGADPARIAFVRGGSENIIKQIRDAAESFTPDLIIIDTLVEFANAISGTPLEPNDSQRWALVMGEITAFARDFCAVLLLHHSTKNDGRYRDSTAIGAAVDVIIEMFGDGDAPRVLKARGRFPLGETRIKLEGDEFRLVETAEEFEARLLKFVASHARCSFKELRDALGGGTSELTKVRDRLLKTGALVNVGTAGAHSYMTRKP